jgi:hypothetical protein
MADQTTSKQLYDLLVTKNFDLQALDSRTGRAPVDEQGQPDIAEADEFRFDFVTDSGKNYGSVVVLVGDDNNLTMFFGDSVGKTMEAEDKKEWFDFLYQMKQFATKHFLTFSPENITKLKYTKQGQAAIKEGLFESWQGKGDTSWNGNTTEARLLIKHKKKLGENDARFRYIESIYVETADGERFKLKNRSLTAGKAMLEHVRQGGNPYDVRGQHINEIVEELSVLSRFRRANTGKVLEGDTKNLVEQTDSYYKNMHSVLKHLGTSRGYQSYFESWSPADIDAGNLVVEDLKELFVQQTIDHRIEEALPLLARITQENNKMKEAQIFESWVNNLVEGTWAIPETPEQQQELIELLSSEFMVGPDATNATEQLYNILGDDELFDQLQELADSDANADARPVIMARLQELAPNSPEIAEVLAQVGDIEQNGEETIDPAELAADVDSDEQLPQEVEEDQLTEGRIIDEASEALDHILNRFKFEVKQFEQGGELDSDLYEALFDYYADKGEMPYAVAKAKAGDPINWVSEKLNQYLGIDEGMLDEFGIDTLNQLASHPMAGPLAAAGGAALGGVIGKGIEKAGDWYKNRKEKQALDKQQAVAEGSCNHTMEGDYCPEHGLEECMMAPMTEYTGNWTNFGLEESDALTRLKALAHGK